MPARPVVRWLAAPVLIVLVAVAAVVASRSAAGPPSPTAAQEQVTEAWVARYNGPANGDDRAGALVVDGSGNVYVTGASCGSAGPDCDYATVEYDASGAQQWVARYNGPTNGYDRAGPLAVDGSGNVYVTGESCDGTLLWCDYATVKYNPSGAEQWVARYGGPASGNDGGGALALDGLGNVYVTGDSGGVGTVQDYATVKYNAEGVEQWVARYDGPANEWDYAHALALDGSGNVYVTGTSGGVGTVQDYATIKYAQGPTDTPTATATSTPTDTPTPTATPSGGPDLVVEDIFSAQSLPYDCGTPAGVKVVVGNVGSQPAGPSTTAVWAASGDMEFVPTPGLAPGQSVTMLATVAGIPSGDTYAAFADSGFVVDEMNETNNLLSKYLTALTLPTCTPTATATPASPAVGGIAELPSLAGASPEQGAASAEGSGWSAGGHAEQAGLGAVAAAVVAVCGWYARRRWLR